MENQHFWMPLHGHYGGKPRKTINTSKADLGIVKLGQTDVMVIF